MSVELLPCPFCGGEAQIEQRGTPRQSCVVECGSCGLRHDSGDEGERCGASWNRRAALATPAAVAPAVDAGAKTDLVERMKLARQAGLQLRIDSKFGSDHYYSVTGSWPALIRFAAALSARASDAAADEPVAVGPYFMGAKSRSNEIDPENDEYSIALVFDSVEKMRAAERMLSDFSHAPQELVNLRKRLEYEHDCNEAYATKLQEYEINIVDLVEKVEKLQASATHPASEPKAQDLDDRIRRLQAAIEGECDGLAIDETHATAILEYVDNRTYAFSASEPKAPVCPACRANVCSVHRDEDIEPKALTDGRILDLAEDHQCDPEFSHYVFKDTELVAFVREVMRDGDEQ